MRRGFLNEEAFSMVADVIKHGKNDIDIFQDMNQETDGGVSIAFIRLLDKVQFKEIEKNKRKYDIAMPVSSDGRLVMILFQSIDRMGTEIALKRMIKKIHGGRAMDLFGSFAHIRPDKKKEHTLEGFYRALDLLVMLARTPQKNRMYHILDEVI